MIIASRAYQANSRSITTSDEMLQEMIECYELEFPEPLDFKNRDTRRVICYSFILRLYTLRLDDCIAESNALFEILDSCLDYVLLWESAK